MNKIQYILYYNLQKMIKESQQLNLRYAVIQMLSTAVVPVVQK